MWVFTVFGCHHEESVALPEKPPVDAPVPFVASTEESAMIQRLSNKDGAPPCAEVEALSPTPVVALQHIVQGVSRPPTVPMRAADCLITGHSSEITATLQGWVADPGTKGLALLVLDRLDQMSPDVAVILAKGALAGPHRELANERVGRAANPSVRALAGGAP